MDHDQQLSVSSSLSLSKAKMVLKLKNTIVIPCITLLLLVLSTLPSSSSSSSSHEQQQTYIIHVSKPHKPTIFTTHHHWYTSTLTSLPPSPHPTKILYTYDHTLHGFSARLTPSQAAALEKISGIKKVVPERVRHVHTTRSPDFLGLNHVSGLWPNTDYADDIVIGVFDTGVWPERRSFSDDGLLTVPTKFKGTCETSKDFPVSSCNKKLVGARFFLAGYEARYGPINETLESRSPRDTEGHGTHTASTSAGSSVKDAGFYEYAVGEARGVAAKARIAVYKICWKEGCFDADILGALDQAIDDGVDVISISLGIDRGLDYDDDSFSIGAFGAVEKGVIVSSAAGNSGPKKSTIENIAPWIMTVGASTIDRSFPADAVLGDGSAYKGVSLYSGDRLDPTVYLPLVYAGDHGHRLCVPNTLSADVKGKIVLCDGGISSTVEKGSAVKLAGGAGMILASTGSSASADVHVIPTTMVDPTAGDKIRNYIKSDKSPTAKISFHGTVIGPTPSSPRVASFSSRGPNEITPEIIKPDVIAPGVNILASWTGARSPSELDTDLRRVEFNFQSGTSMACPHVSGVAALLRRAHPKWSPAAVKSAIMTTAYQLDNTANNLKDISTGKESTPFDHGSGHVDPNRAVDPGLIYDLTTTDYIGFLCSIGYEEDRIGIIVKDRTVDCSTMGLDSPGNLNYPSFSVIFKSSDGVVKYRRVVTNVGESVDAVYEVKVTSPAAVDVVVLPSKLVFSAQNQTLLYEVKFSSLEVSASAQFGSIEWSDGVHVVRSPIAFTWGEEDYVSSI